MSIISQSVAVEGCELYQMQHFNSCFQRDITCMCSLTRTGWGAIPQERRSQVEVNVGWSVVYVRLCSLMDRDAMSFHRTAPASSRSRFWQRSMSTGEIYWDPSRWMQPTLTRSSTWCLVLKYRPVYLYSLARVQPITIGSRKKQRTRNWFAYTTEWLWLTDFATFDIREWSDCLG